MLGRTHQIIGITAGVGAFLYVATPTYQPATFASAVVLCHFLALLPDIDQPLTDFWKTVPTGRYLGKVAAPFLGHRNITHSVLGCILIWYALKVLGLHIPSQWGIDTDLVRFVGMVAYISHLLADMWTVEGIPLLFPNQHTYGLPPKPLEGIRIITGKWFENLVIFPIANLIFVLLLISNWDLLSTYLLIRP